MVSELEQSVIDLIEEFRGRLPTEFVDEYISLAVHAEWGAAYENLCEQLFEFDIVPTADEFRRIADIGQRMHFPETTWNFLRQGGN